MIDIHLLTAFTHHIFVVLEYNNCLRGVPITEFGLQFTVIIKYIVTRYNCHQGIWMLLWKTAAADNSIKKEKAMFQNSQTKVDRKRVCLNYSEWGPILY